MKSKNLPGIQIICKPCPLISKLPNLNNPLARRCGEIIENARHIWGYLSPEEQSVYYEIVGGEEIPKKFPPYSTLKLTSARSIQRWYTEHSNLTLTNQKTPEAIKKAVQDVRRAAGPSIESNITDKEILAIFAICEAFDAIYHKTTKEAVLTASMFLNLAKTGLEPEKQTPASTPKVIPFPTPSGTQWHEVKISFIDKENIRISINGMATTKNYVEMGFKNRSKPSILWVSFKELAQVGGSFAGYSDEKKVKIKELFSDLRKKLTLYFQIEGDPIPYIKGEGYRTSFILENKSYSLENEDSIRQQNTSYVPPRNKHTGRKGYEDMT